VIVQQTTVVAHGAGQGDLPIALTAEERGQTLTLEEGWDARPLGRVVRKPRDDAVLDQEGADGVELVHGRLVRHLESPTAR